MKKKIVCLVLAALLIVPAGSFAAETGSMENYIEMTDAGVMIEAEDLTWKNGFQVWEDELASGGKSMTHSDTSVSTMDQPIETLGPTLTLNLDVKRADNYAIYFRIRSHHGTYYTCWIQMDGRTQSYRNPPISEEYGWSSIITYRMSEGIHRIDYYYGHSMIIDKIIITNNAAEVPTGMGELPHRFELGENSGSTENLIYPLPPVVPSEEHPRLFVTKEQIPTVKANLEHPQNIKIYQRLLKTAEGEKDCVLDPEVLSDNSNMEYLDYIEANAFLYLIHQDRAAGEKAVKGILNYMNSLNVDAGNPADRNGMNAVFVSGMVYDWCYDLFSQEQKAELINTSLLAAGKGEMKWPPTGENAFTSDHGDECGLLRNLFAFSIAVYGDYDQAYQMVAGRLFSEYLPSRNEKYRESIFNPQGDNYGYVRSGADWFFKALLHGLGADNLLIENMHFQAYQQIYRRLPNSNFMRDGDIYDPALGSYYVAYPACTFFAANLYKDPYVKNEFFRANIDGTAVKMADASITNALYLLLNDVNVGTLPKEQLPLSIYTGDASGIMTARTSWEEGMNSNSLAVSMKVPENFYSGHEHRDAGHFYIYYKGPLAIDSGNYESMPFVDQNGTPVTASADLTYNSKHNTNYARQTIAHNCMLIYDPDEIAYHRGGSGEIVNSGGQHAFQTVADDLESYKNDLKVNTVLGKDFGKDLNKPDYTYLSGDITGVYGSKAKEYTRSFMFFNFFDDVYPGALVVFDRVNASNASFKKTWLLHSVEEPEIADNRTTIRNTNDGYNGRLINDTLLPKADDLQIEKVGGPGNEFLIGDWNWTAHSRYKVGDESGKWRVEISPQKSAEQNYFLNVIQVADNTLNPEPLPTELLESDLFYGVKIKDRAAFFAKTSKRVSKTFNINISGETGEQVTVAIADLAEGTWDVLKDGQTVATEYVSEEGSVLSFTGECGEYTIQKSRSYLEPIHKSFNILDNLDLSFQPYTQVCYNGVYDSSVKVLEHTYLPLKDMAMHADNLANTNDKGESITIGLYDDTARREAVFTEGNTQVQLTYGGETTTITIQEPPRKIDGNWYIHYGDLKETLDINASYESVGDIIFASSTFSRVDNSSFIVNSDDPTRARIKDIKAVGFLEQSPPYQAVDGNIASQFAISGKDTQVTIELEESTDLKGLSIIWADQVRRTEKFAIDVSEDGENYTEVWNGESSIVDGDGYTFEDFDFSAQNVRFVRLRMFGNSTNDWNTINEMYIRK